MTIQIQQPELEALIEQRMATGHFRNVEDVLLAALKDSASEDTGSIYTRPLAGLEEVFANGRKLLEGAELDVSRDASSARSIDLG